MNKFARYNYEGDRIHAAADMLNTMYENMQFYYMNAREVRAELAGVNTFELDRQDIHEGLQFFEDPDAVLAASSEQFSDHDKELLLLGMQLGAGVMMSEAHDHINWALKHMASADEELDRKVRRHFDDALDEARRHSMSDVADSIDYEYTMYDLDYNDSLNSRQWRVYSL